MSAEQIGATLASGPDDWQILQQGTDGTAAMHLTGRWASPDAGLVEVRIVYEATGQPVRRTLDWQPATTMPDGFWEATLASIPAGGLYRLETRYNPHSNLAGEWSMRGDMRHFLGVGDLWVITGQSNSAGYGKGPVYDPPELGVHLLGHSERWMLAAHPLNDGTDTLHPVSRETANPVHSPYLHFGRLLQQALGYPIGLVQTALGGSPLSAWNPTEPGGAILFENMVHCVQRAGGRAKGVLWYQGESDATEDLAPSYAERFQNAVAAWREALHDPTLPVLTVQLNRYYAENSGGLEQAWSLLREAQRQIPHRLAEVSVVPALDLPLGDLIHTSAAGNMVLAARLANAALGAVYGREIAYQAPEPTVAQRQGEGRTVVLSFAPVTSRMDNLDLTSCCFHVQDTQGPVPVERVVYPGDDTVRLVLGRTLVGAAVVHGAPGLAPPPVPLDMERFMPMLAFHGLVVD
jgi:sialate O-acetylesterase